MSIVRFQSGIFGLYDSNSNNWGCTPKSPLFEHKTDIILRNRHWHRFRSFIVVYFIFCFRKKIFFQSQQYNIGFSWKHFLRFLIFFKMNPKYFSLRRSCRLNRVFYRLPWKYAQKMQHFSCIFCATFRTKLCNTRFKRQDLLREVVDSKMFLFYCSQIGQCSSANTVFKLVQVQVKRTTNKIIYLKVERTFS